MSGFVFHLPGSSLRDPSLLKPYYVKLTEGLAARGARVEMVIHHRELVPAQVASDGAFHVVDHGKYRHDRVLNTGIAYVYPFWNLDPWGIRALSSIVTKQFDPGKIDADEARAFADRLRKRWVAPRKSRYEQPQEMVKIPEGCVAVFLQSEGHRDVAETCYLHLRDMVGALLARTDPRAIVIKPHPRDADVATRRYLTRIAESDARVRIVDANIHDILANAAVCVTINSAVGIEAMLHGKPVVLCGQADFHHAAVTVRSPAAMNTGIEEAVTTPWKYNAFIYWYFAINCLNAGKTTLADDFLGRVVTTGFDVSSAGL